MISVLILTKNEQQDLPGCLQSVSWSDDIHVYDSGSTDESVNVALSYGAKITERKYDKNMPAFGGDESSHRNWGLENIPFRYSWVLVVDADERVTPGLRISIQAKVISPGDMVAFRLQRRDFFLNTWLKHVQV
ncbi:MAG: glycosyltransferase family 2 protein, partial [Cytophaga sp.]|nr:glycosyltransferase family 2 protein [Undibacterium sp.]